MQDGQGYLVNLPVIPYSRAHEVQLAVVKARHQGTLHRDVVLMLEHAPVFTMGRRGGRQNLLVPMDLLEERGIDLVNIERGGDITYHGPGQLVAYVLMDLHARRISVTDFVTRLETAMTRTAAHWGVIAQGDPDNRGAWIGRRKLGSVGITVRRGITFHGLALNVATDLEPFQWINPCGLTDCRMTTLEQETGRAIEMKAARLRMALHLSDLLDLELEAVGLEALERQLDLDTGA